MGRGRAKAKQVKVARQLKYNSGGTNLDRLRDELAREHQRDDEPEPSYDDLADRYAVDEDDDEDEDEEEDDEDERWHSTG